MKLFISADLEGVAGVTSGDQMLPTNFEWERAREWMTEELIACLEGAREAGVEEVIVCDSHGNGQNILIERLPDYARLVRSGPKPLLQMQGIETDGLVGSIFLGYHVSNKGTGGVLSHSFSGASFREVRLNGVNASEGYINAAIAGEYGVPLLLVTGDSDVVREIQDHIPTAEGAVVKQAHSFLSSTNIAPIAAQALIRKKTRECLENLDRFKPFVVEPPYELEIEFISRIPPEILNYLPIFERLDPFTIRYHAQEMVEVLKCICFTLYYRLNR